MSRKLDPREPTGPALTITTQEITTPRVCSIGLLDGQVDDLAELTHLEHRRPETDAPGTSESNNGPIIRR
jgi:hypothetical protein